MQATKPAFACSPLQLTNSGIWRLNPIWMKIVEAAIKIRLVTAQRVGVGHAAEARPRRWGEAPQPEALELLLLGLRTRSSTISHELEYIGAAANAMPRRSVTDIAHGRDVFGASDLIKRPSSCAKKRPYGTTKRSIWNHIWAPATFDLISTSSKSKSTFFWLSRLTRDGAMSTLLLLNSAHLHWCWLTMNAVLIWISKSLEIQCKFNEFQSILHLWFFNWCYTV